MNTGNTGHFDQAHLAQWLETTRYYLFADLERLAAPSGNALLQMRQDSRGAQARFIARVRALRFVDMIQSLVLAAAGVSRCMAGSAAMSSISTAMANRSSTTTTISNPSASV